MVREAFRRRTAPIRISLGTTRQPTGRNRVRALGAGRERRYRRRLAAVGGGKESRGNYVERSHADLLPERHTAFGINALQEPSARGTGCGRGLGPGIGGVDSVGGGVTVYQYGHIKELTSRSSARVMGWLGGSRFAGLGFATPSVSGSTPDLFKASSWRRSGRRGGIPPPPGHGRAQRRNRQTPQRTHARILDENPHRRNTHHRLHATRCNCARIMPIHRHIPPPRQRTMTRKGPGKSFRKGPTLLEVADMFRDEVRARHWLELQRWPHGPCCPECGSLIVQSGIRHRNMTHRCRDCPERTCFSGRARSWKARSSATGFGRSGFACS